LSNNNKIKREKKEINIFKKILNIKELKKIQKIINFNFKKEIQII